MTGAKNKKGGNKVLREPIEQLIYEPIYYTRDITFPDPKEIRIYDSTLRDGEQMVGVALSPEQKLEIARRLSDIGVHILDVGFPSVSASEQKTLSLIIEARKRGEIREDVEVVVMCRSNRKDIDATIQAIEEVNVNPDEVTFFIFTSASDLHIKYKLGRTLLKREGRSMDEWLDLPIEWYRDANVDMMLDCIRYARGQGVKSIEYGGEDGSRADVDYIIRLHKEGLRAGGTRPSVPDTVGCLTPEATAAIISRLVQAVPEAPLLVHFHNDFGLSVINTITALKHGARAFCVTGNGYGERAGNASIHEVLTALRLLYGVELPGFKYEKLTELSRFLEWITGYPLQAHEPIVGLNAFSHETGIHTAGVLVDRRVYETIPSELVGGKQRFVFGKHTGTQLVRFSLERNKARLDAAGVEITEALVKQVTNEVKRIREERIPPEAFKDKIFSYYQMLESLPLTEGDMIDVAIALAKARDDSVPA